MSDAATEGPLLWHLTGTFERLESILFAGQINAVNTFGAARLSKTLASTQRAVCLSEILPKDRGRLAEQHGKFGLAFSTTWARQRGAAPVWYLPVDTNAQRELEELVRKMAYVQVPSLDHPLWKLTPFIDFPGIHVRNGRRIRYEWTWEREWRVVGDLVFGQHDVEAIFAPRCDHDALANLWESGLGLNGDVPRPPLIDLAMPLNEQDDVRRRGKTPMTSALSAWMRSSEDLVGVTGVDTAPQPLEWVTDEELIAAERAEERAALLEAFDRDDD